jgi:hypothetical protein
MANCFHSAVTNCVTFCPRGIKLDDDDDEEEEEEEEDEDVGASTVCILSSWFSFVLSADENEDDAE